MFSPVSHIPVYGAALSSVRSDAGLPASVHKPISRCAHAVFEAWLYGLKNVVSRLLLAVGTADRSFSALNIWAEKRSLIAPVAVGRNQQRGSHRVQAQPACAVAAGCRLSLPAGCRYRRRASSFHIRHWRRAIRWRR